MSKPSTLINHPPGSNELRKEKAALGYGLFKSAIVEIPIRTPDNDDVFLILQENDSLILKTSFRFLQQWLEYTIEKLSSHIKPERKYQSLLRKARNNEVAFIQSALDQKGNEEYTNILSDFRKSIIRNRALYLWDKHLQQYVPCIEHYEVIDHPAVCAGNAKEYYAYKGEEIASYYTTLY